MVYTPWKTFCNDEPTIPFQGPLNMKQYIIPKNIHEYGWYETFLVMQWKWLYIIRIYAGKERNHRVPVARNVVIDLSRNLLNSGRDDNYYPWSIFCLTRKSTMYCEWTVKQIQPKSLKKLQKGEEFGLENENGEIK